MPKGKYRRKKSLCRKRKRINKWREKKAEKTLKDVSVDSEKRQKFVSPATNTPPAKRERCDPRIHTRSCSAISVDLTEKERRMQIFWYWRDTLDAPPPSQWKGFDGTISVIVRQLHLFKGSRGTVENVLKKAWFLHTKGKIYDGRSARVGKPSNNPLAIKPGSLEEQIVADCYEDGFSLARTAEKVYRLRKTIDPENAKAPGPSAMSTCIRRLNPVVTGMDLII